MSVLVSLSCHRGSQYPILILQDLLGALGCCACSFERASEKIVHIPKSMYFGTRRVPSAGNK